MFRHIHYRIQILIFIHLIGTYISVTFGRTQDTTGKTIEIYLCFNLKFADLRSCEDCQRNENLTTIIIQHGDRLADRLPFNNQKNRQDWKRSSLHESNPKSLD